MSSSSSESSKSQLVLLQRAQVSGPSSSLQPRQAPTNHVLWGSVEDNSGSSDKSGSSSPFKPFGAAVPTYVRRCPSSSGASGDESEGVGHIDAVPGEHQPLCLADLVRTEPELDSDGELTSMGSKHHPDSCVPCVFAALSDGCPNGLDCEFCHRTHEIKRKKQRPCKSQRMRYKKQVERMEECIEDCPDSFNVATVLLPPSMESNAHLKGKVVQRLQDHKKKVLAKNIDKWLTQEQWLAQQQAVATASVPTPVGPLASGPSAAFAAYSSGSPPTWAAAATSSRSTYGLNGQFSL